MSAKDPSLAKALRLVSMSFDPTHDTPERMRAYSSVADERANDREPDRIAERLEHGFEPQVLTARPGKRLGFGDL